MNIIVDDRGSGKTTQCIKESYHTGYPIVCINAMHADQIKGMALYILGPGGILGFPEPITLYELDNPKDGKRPSTYVIVDEIVSLFEYKYKMIVHLATATRK